MANSLAVMAAVHAAGGDLGAAGLALAEMGGLKGRGARHRLDGAGRPRAADRRKLQRQSRLDARDAGAARRDPGVAAHRGARQHEGTGRLRARVPRPAGRAARARRRVDYAVLVGEEMAALARELGKPAQNALGIRLAFAHCRNPGEAIAALEEFGLAGGDAVLVKGSNSVGLGRVVAHFAGREG